jgi:tRNA pseudouridine13 synthase
MMQAPEAFSLPDWPRAGGESRVKASIRVHNTDFFVEEIPRTPPDGEGGHWWLWVEKNGANTDWVAGRLARMLGCQHRDIGYAGLKDRHAVTWQWFSVPVGDDAKPDWDHVDIEGVQLIEARRSTRKIRRGALEGNRFRIIARHLEGDPQRLEESLQFVANRGVPNYFGPQRFGHDGGNVVRGAAWLAAPGRLPRHKRSLYLSAVRSFLFNEVLADRVRQGNWDQILPGELVMLDGSRSFFESDPADGDLPRRCREFDVHPSGPLPGRPDKQASGLAFQLEQTVLARWPGWPEALEVARVDAARRSLRLVPKELSWHISPDKLELVFFLPAGAFATSVLREIIQTKSR